MALFSHWREVPEWVWELTPNFHPSVDRMLSSPDTGAIQVHLPSYVALQAYRNLSGRTRILSGYRSPIYNARLRGSSPRSLHKELIAFDVDLTGKDPIKEEEFARQAGFTGLGRYPTREFMHMDMGRPRHWYGSKKDKQWWFDNIQALTKPKVAGRLFE